MVLSVSSPRPVNRGGGEDEVHITGLAEGVATGSTNDPIPTEAADDQVITRPGVDDVVAVAAIDVVRLRASY